jgi:hypothetical protein
MDSPDLNPRAAFGTLTKLGTIGVLICNVTVTKNL